MDSPLLLPTVVAAALADISFATLLGLAVIRLWLSPGEQRVERSRIATASLASQWILLSAIAAQAWLLTAEMLATSDASIIRAQLASVLTSTHAGRLLATQFVLMLLLLAATRLVHHQWTDTGLLLLLTAARAGTGHAATNGDFTVREAMQFVHLASTSLWAGTILAAGLFVLPAMLRAGAYAAFFLWMRTVSRTVTYALAGVVISGVYNSYVGLGGSLSPVLTSLWGRLLLVKSCLVAVALALGLWNRLMLRARDGLTHQQAARIASVVRVEAFVMLVILGVSAWLANSPPASSP